jgi:trimethylamine---corrinoid protein Co-methyltransferase
MFETPLDILTDEQVQMIHDQAMTLLEETGTDVLHPGMLELLAKQGLAIDGDRVRWDRSFIMEKVALAPSSFTVRGRNRERDIHVGGGSQIWTNVGGPPFASDLDEGRRSGRLQDHDTLVKLTQATDLLTCVQSGAVEAVELDVNTRHMDMDYSTIRWSDKPYIAYGTSGPKARDGIELAAIVHGGHDAIAETAGIMGVVNPNSPLIWDFRMVDALMEWASFNQPVIVTPFLLAGGTAPVSVSGALSIQVAEALTGVAMAQVVREGAPAMYGSFFTSLDMRTGSPAFGTPESVFAVIAGGQLARHYGLPFRGGGGLASSNAVDAQAASETQMMLWATLLAGTDVAMHAAGWLEGGLVGSFEKFALDLELLGWFRRLREGIGFTDEELALETIRQMGPGGLYLEAEHTMVHFKEWLPMNPLFLTPDHAAWNDAGRPSTEQTANTLWKKLLARYEDPGIDPAVDDELQAYMARRRAEPVVEEE